MVERSILIGFLSGPNFALAKILLTSPIDNNVPTRGLFAVETKSSFVNGWHIFE